MSQGLANILYLFQSAKMEDISMPNTKTVVLETSEEFLVDAKLQQISCQVPEPTMFQHIKTSPQKESTVYRTLKTVWQEVSALLKGEMWS